MAISSQLSLDRLELARLGSFVSSSLCCLLPIWPARAGGGQRWRGGRKACSGMRPPLFMAAARGGRRSLFMASACESGGGRALGHRPDILVRVAAVVSQRSQRGLRLRICAGLAVRRGEAVRAVALLASAAEEWRWCRWQWRI